MAQKITLSLDTSESESKWDSKKFDSIKTPRSEHTCAEHNGKIFVIGGKDSNSEVLPSVEVLDMMSEKRDWISGPLLPPNFKAYDCHVLKYEYDLYLIGGEGTVLLLDSNGTQWITHNVSIEKRAWNFLPAAKIKAGNCLKGEVLIIVLLYLHKFACN